MRRLASALFIGLVSSGAQHLASPAAPDSVEYDKAVARVWGSITSTENVRPLVHEECFESRRSRLKRLIGTGRPGSRR